MQSLIDQLCPPVDLTLVPDRPTCSPHLADRLNHARECKNAKYGGGSAIFVTKGTMDGLRQLFGAKLKSHHIREFLEALATGHYRVTRVARAKTTSTPPVTLPTAPVVSAAAVGPGWTLHQLAAEFNVPYHIILTRVRQGFIAATRRGKRRLVVSNAEVDRLRTVGLR